MELYFFLNGSEVRDPTPDPEMSLLHYLRMHVTGSKVGCGEGGCGTCTVMVSKYNQKTKAIQHYSINACLVPVCLVHGMAVTTIEGIGSIKEGLHPCQERIAKAHGSQCGFCTPGFVMSMYTLLRNNPNPSQSELECALEGNLCRCTGYRAILDGYKTFCSDCSCGRGKDSPGKYGDRLFNEQEFIPYPTDKDRDYIFPPKLKETPPPLLNVSMGGVSWYTPTLLQELVQLRSRYPVMEGEEDVQCRLVVGNNIQYTDAERKKYSILINPSHVRELYVLEESNGEGLLVGAGVSLTELENKLKELINQLPLFKTRVFQAFVEMMRWFAGPQIRNTASLGGSIASASPKSDILPILIACEAKVVAVSWSQETSSIIERSFKMDPSFVMGDHKTALKPNEIIKSVLLPFTTKSEYVMSYKQSRRRTLDTAIVNSCFRIMLTDSGLVKDCHFIFGGMGSKSVAASKTEQLLIGKSWSSSEVLSECISSLADELLLEPAVEGGMPDYRTSLALSLFYKFHLFVANQIGGISANELAAINPFQREPTEGSQGFQRVLEFQPSVDPVGRPMMGVSNLKQASGEARYLDDVPQYERELYAGLVLSERAHAKFTMDTSAVMGIEGVVDVVTANDVPGSNVLGNEVVFAEGHVTSVGQIMAIILAKDRLIARKAVKSVIISYEELPAILTMEDAIRENKPIEPVRTISRGNIKQGLSESFHVSEGTIRTGAQHHFYLETQGTIAVPMGEDGEMEIISSTQLIGGVQASVAAALGVPSGRVVCKTKRVGGGFGGKLFRSLYLSAAVAVAANKSGVPVRVAMDRIDDTVYSGTRHPFLGQYKAGFTKDGLITSLDLQLFSNTGYSADSAVSALEKAMPHTCNAYNIPNLHVVGKAYLTNTLTCTPFRGFGCPEGMIIAEDIMDRAAYELGIDPIELRFKNLVRSGNVLPSGVEIEDNYLIRCWETLLETSQYKQRRIAVDEFNRNNKWIKRGLAMVPTAAGIGFGDKFLLQAGALLHIYRDGSVLLSHSGVELGQGLHTKMIQVCSHCLGVPSERVHISETSSDKVPNSSPTAASVSTDLNGAAVKDACDQIMARLKPYQETHPDISWNDLVKTAYMDRVNLSAQGFYKTPGIGYDWNSGEGRLYNYCCYGVGCSEIELDTLGGGFKILRSDILMDAGNSINPAIDVGQVEGAFTQGLGLFTMEEVVYLEDGRLFTNSPGNYKIPSCSDIPIELNVSLMDRVPNPRAIFSSKAVGEPPLFLAASVFFAIKDAIRSCRVERGHSAVFDLFPPATVERIRMACEDQFTEIVKDRMKKNFSNLHKRWNVTP